MITIDDMVQREVMCCMSSMVHTLAMAYHATMPSKFANGISTEGREAQALFEQAFELSAPVLDYEEAATQAGWRVEKNRHGANAFVCRSEPDVGLESSANPDDACGWEDLCCKEHLEPYEREVYEHWAVSNWLADALEDQGERVDRDFAGLNVWARTTTGQAISMDDCMQRVYAALTEST